MGILKKHKTNQMNFQILYNKEAITLNEFSTELSQLKKEVNSQFSLKDGTYKLSYQDFDGDHIEIADDDDLAVCILEFSENSVVDQSIVLVVEGGEKAEEEIKLIAESDFFKKHDVKIAKSEILVTEEAKDEEAFESIDDKVSVSQMSEQVKSIVDEKFEDIKSQVSAMESNVSDLVE